MAYMMEITSYKEKMAQKFCTSDGLSALLKMVGEESMSASDLMYNRVFPYEYVPDVTEVNRAFVCFDIDVVDVESDIIKIVDINVYVFCGKEIIRLPDSKGIRTDVMASEVDKIMNGNRTIGLGAISLLTCKTFVPMSGYYGRQIRYRVKDFNKYICEGWS